jgi:tRNA(fMet)-specific endonuclease VapC
MGKTAPFVDGQIAAIAHVHGLVLVTTNIRHFESFTRLMTENWSKPVARAKTWPARS